MMNDEPKASPLFIHNSSFIVSRGTLMPGQPRYDVLVVGSGASGGWAAKRLSEAGLKVAMVEAGRPQSDNNLDRKSTRLNSSHLVISYAVFCLKKKKKKK